MKLYHPKKHFDELLTKSGNARRASRLIVKWLNQATKEEIKERSDAAVLTVKEMGISYTVYSEGSNLDRAWPFDIVPRIISATEWTKVQEGLIQRTKALNHFIHDVYNENRILREKIIPEELILNSPNYRKECIGIKPKHKIWAHICGSDLIRNHQGEFQVLEDNLRVPSGVVYMIENREITKRILPDLFSDHSVLPVDDYPAQLYKTLSSLSFSAERRPCIAVLTPGIYNSAYFEHAFLAQQMGVELVEGSDLIVDKKNMVYMKTVSGLVKVDVIYRRINEEFLDPEIFRKDSLLGCKGIIRAWREGNVSIVNAPGSGIADDKAIYAYVPKMIRFYLNEEPLIKNVETFLCREPDTADYVIKNIDKLVVKPVNESGGKGVLIGPNSTLAEKKTFTELLKKTPDLFVAQPTLSLSTAPTIIQGDSAPRHLDLRPFILSGKNSWVSTGGLTRVALKEGSLVVNSSQGGGSKDTWIIEEKG